MEYFKKGTGYDPYSPESFVPWTQGPGPVSYVSQIDQKIGQDNTDGFFVRYGAILDNQDASYGRGYIYFPVPGVWTFIMRARWNDSGTLFIDNQAVISGWNFWAWCKKYATPWCCSKPCEESGRGTIDIPAAGYYPIQLDWNAGEEVGESHLYWIGPAGSGIDYQLVSSANYSSCQTPVSCTVDLTPDPATVQVGGSTPLTASVSVEGGGSVDRVDFASGNSGIASVNPASDDTVVYSTQATGVSAGSTTVTANVIVSGSPACTDNTTVNVTATANPWWQVKDSDVTAGGDLVSSIPLTCSLPVCNPVFGLQGTGGFPGVPAYSGSYDFLAGAGYGNAAEDPYNWLANSIYASTKIYDFSYFKRQIPPDVAFTEITTPTVNGGDFNSGGAPSRGYIWYHYDGSTLGDMTIAGNVNLTGSRRVVLLVEGADLNITGRINIQSPGNGFFMAIVGKDLNGLKGNIIVDQSVSHPTVAGIEGVFLAEGQFRTGAGSGQLWVRGAVASYGGFVLERDLGGAANTTKPAELFEYAPDIISVFPQVFTTRRIRWKEVAP